MNNLPPLYESLGDGDIIQGANSNASIHVLRVALKKLKLLYMVLMTRDVTRVGVAGVGPGPKTVMLTFWARYAFKEVPPTHML